jgi:hypothetical protein
MADEITIPALPCRDIDEIGDSHGLDARAAEILDAALERDGGAAPATDRLEALAYRAELALRVDDPPGAAATLTRARSISLTDAERTRLVDTLASLDDMEAIAVAEPAP